jgi:hypothetical protein
VLQRFDDLGFEPYTLEPEAFARVVQADIEATKKLAARLGVKPQ